MNKGEKKDLGDSPGKGDGSVLTAVPQDELAGLTEEVQMLRGQVQHLAPQAARFQRISKLQTRLLNLLDEEQASIEELSMALGGLTSNIFGQLHMQAHRRMQGRPQDHPAPHGLEEQSEEAPPEEASEEASEEA